MEILVRLHGCIGELHVLGGNNQAKKIKQQFPQDQRAGCGGGRGRAKPSLR